MIWFMSWQKKGADFAVYVNTAQEADGSDSGARPDEAITWGKIKIDAKPVKVFLKISEFGVVVATSAMCNYNI